MRYREATSMIAAGSKPVWTLLTYRANRPVWDCGLDAVEERITMRKTMEFRTQTAPSRTFPVNATTPNSPVLLRFSGGLPFAPSCGARTDGWSGDTGGAPPFHKREERTRPLLELNWRPMLHLGSSFDRCAQGLEQRTESDG